MVPRYLRGAALAAVAVGALTSPALADRATTDRPPSQPQSPSPSPSQASAADRAFLVAAGQAGAFEIQSGQLALQRSESRTVRKIAFMIVRDHLRQARQLQKLGRRYGVTIPTTPSPAQAAIIEQLRGLQGAAFEQAWLAAQITAHRDVAIPLHVDEARAGSAWPIRHFAFRSLPVLFDHLWSLERAQAGTQQGNGKGDDDGRGNGDRD